MANSGKVVIVAALDGTFERRGREIWDRKSCGQIQP